MPNWVDGVIVALLAIGASVLVGILGYLVDKNEGKSEGDNSSQPAEHRAEVKKA